MLTLKLHLFCLLDYLLLLHSREHAKTEPLQNGLCLRFMHCLAHQQKPPDGDPQWIPFRRFYDRHKVLQDVIRNINIFRDIAELISHIALVDGDVLVFEVRRIEGEVFQDALQDRIEAAGANVFGLYIHTGGNIGDGGEGVLGEGDVLSCLHQEYTFFFLATVVFLALSYLTGSTLI